MVYSARILRKKNLTPIIRPNMKKLTIMVSLYNSGEWIENRLNNLLESTMNEHSEIWCVNANSPDLRDEQIPLKYPVKYHRLSERIGVYAAWNYIIKNSNSEYITNANSDDIVAPNCFERLMTVLDHAPEYDFAYPSWHSTSVANQKWASLKEMDSAGKPGTFCGNLDSAGVGHFPLWRRSVHDKIGHFDESFKAAGDADWWLRSHYIAKSKFIWVNEFLGCYLYRHGANLWHSEMTSEEWGKLHTKTAEYKRGKNG